MCIIRLCICGCGRCDDCDKFSENIRSWTAFQGSFSLQICRCLRYLSWHWWRVFMWVMKCEFVSCYMCQMQGHRYPGRLGSWTSWKYVGGIRVSFVSVKYHILSFVDNIASFPSSRMKDVSKMEGKINFRGACRLLGTGIVECITIL